MTHLDQQFQRGQSLAITALLLFAVVGILALVFDGGNGFLQRRMAQNAADAAALAGARELCVTGDYAAATNRAIEYATRNGILTANITVTVGSGLVNVETAIPFQTAFGGALGQPSLTAGGIAEAGCFTPSSSTGVLPIAFACKPPGVLSDSLDCEMLFGQIYILLWGRTTETVYCQPSGTVDCDVNDDGVNDIMGDGDRSWLNLDGGGGGAAQLNCWVKACDPNLLINYHRWLPSASGVTNAVYQTVEDYRLGQTVILPIFDKLCQGDPQTYCGGLYDAQDQTVAAGGATSTLYFHIKTFALFHVTCVNAPGAGNCPRPNDTVRPNDRWIEGYFVKGFDPNLDGRPSDGADLGAYTLYLTR